MHILRMRSYSLSKFPKDSALPAYFGVIDILRFIAAFMVLFDHYPLFFRQTTQADNWAHAPISAQLFDNSWAVPFFWMISGFVFLFTYRKRNVSGAQFAQQRFARLYPLHFATLLLVVVLQLVALRCYGEVLFIGNFDAYHFILNLGFASAWGFEELGPSFNMPIWSVSVEILIYIVFFLLLPLIKRSGPALCAALSILCFFAYTQGIVHSALLCGTFFFAGCVCFEAVRRMSAKGMIFLGVSITLGAIAVLVVGVNSLKTVQQIALFFGIFCIAAGLDAHKPKFFPGPRSKWNLGNYSYALYLVHYPVMLMIALVVFPVIGEDISFYTSFWPLIGFIVLSTAIAAVTYHLFELPMKRWLSAYPLAEMMPNRHKHT